MKTALSTGMTTKKWLLVAGIALTLAGCGQDDTAQSDTSDQSGTTSSQTQQSEREDNGVGGVNTDDVTMTSPTAEETEEVDPKLLASATKKMDEGREDELTIDEEIALSQSMTTVTNQEDQLEEQGVTKQDVLADGTQKLKAGKDITDTQAEVVEEFARGNHDGELLTLLQKRRHKLANYKHDKTQITKSVGYGDTIELFEKTHKTGTSSKPTGPFYSGNSKPDYYIEDMRVYYYEWMKKDPSKQYEFDKEKTKSLIEQYLPKDAKFQEVTLDYNNEVGNIEEESDSKYSVNLVEHVYKYKSKKAASRLNNDGMIEVIVTAVNLDRNDKTYPTEKFVDDIRIRADHPVMAAQ